MQGGEELDPIAQLGPPNSVAVTDYQDDEHIPIHSDSLHAPGRRCEQRRGCSVMSTESSPTRSPKPNRCAIGDQVASSMAA